MTRRGLGKGLSALIPPTTSGTDPAADIPLEAIVPNPFQPRQQFNDTELEELAASIRQHGVLQPLIVRRVDNHYQLVAGERRFRAAKRAGLERVPAVVREYDDRQMLEVALVENVQRSDINPMDAAQAYQRLMNEFRLTQEALAQTVGKSRPTIANTMRLLDLPAEIQQSIRDGKLSEGHGRALLSAPTPARQTEIYRKVLAAGISVRDTERLSRTSAELPKDPPQQPAPAADADLQAVVAQLRQRFGTKVEITRSSRGGKVVFEFYNEDDLGRLTEMLLGGPVD